MFERLKAWIDEQERTRVPSTGNTGSPAVIARTPANSAPSQIPIGAPTSGSLAEVGRVFVNRLLRPPRSQVADKVPGSLERQVYQQVLSVIRTGVPPESLPKCPATITELLRVLGDENATYQDVARLINEEPLIASEVVKVANSPLFRPKAGEVTSVEHAAQLLGMRELASIASTVMMKKVFDIKPIYFKLFSKYLWDHSLHCAWACRYLAKKAGEDPFTAHLIGLVHDIGKLVIFQELIGALRNTHPGLHPDEEVVASIVDDTAAQLSCVSLKHWNLPVKIQVAVCEQTGKSHPEDYSTLGYILYSANILSEIWMLRQDGAITGQQAAELLSGHGIEPGVLDAVFQRLGANA